MSVNMESVPLYPSQSMILRRYHYSGIVQATAALWLGIAFAVVALVLLVAAIVLLCLGTQTLAILTWQLTVISSMTFGALSALLLVIANATRFATAKLVEALRDDIKLQAGLGLAASVTEPGVRNRLYTGLSLHLCGVRSAQVTYMGTLRKETSPFLLRASGMCRRRLR
jgi:hypothetical protein